MTSHDTDVDLRDAFFDALYEMARQDRDVLFLTADMGAYSLERFRKELPRQFINVGIAEQNLVSVAAGMALSGKRVFIYSIVPFITQRCFEQVKIDLCVMHLPVTFIGAGPGLCYASDGATHHSTEDVALMRALPGLTILNPCDQFSAAGAARIGYTHDGPVYVRIDKGIQPQRHGPATHFGQGAFMLKQGSDLMIVATGIMTHKAFELAGMLAANDIDAGIIDLFRIKPLNEAFLLNAVKGVKGLVTLEEHSLIGGIGSAVGELLIDADFPLPMKRYGVPDAYCTRCGDREWLHKFFEMDVATVLERTVAWYRSIAARQRWPLGASMRGRAEELDPCVRARILPATN